MARTLIPAEKLMVRACHLWQTLWLVLTAGDFQVQAYNAMTIAWGGLGIMWSKPVVQVVVRPTRYTFELMEQYPTFTVCAFPEPYRPALELLGTASGRTGNKILESGLTPIAATQVAAPAFAEAELILECRKVYWVDWAPEHFLDPTLDRNYPNKDYHRMYLGEIIAITGESRFSA
jgi:flavin reductase (DIM6/NTAB) family NADH-FMN oxidoreductase RutF